MLYVDFDIEVREHDSGQFAIAVRSLVGEARTTLLFPFTNAALETELLKVENAILRSSSGRRKNPTTEEVAVQSFGQRLFEFLLSGELLSLYRQCQQLTDAQNKGMRVKLNVLPPGLAGLPWEFLYDSRRRDYLCLDPNTSLVRYLELSEPIRPVTVTTPLRILGLCINALDLGGLDVAEEQRRMNEAVHGLQARGLIELTWLEGQTGDDLLRAMRSGPWHILHFIGHGSFDVLRDEGMIMLADEHGRAAPLSATQLARLLQRQRSSLRLVLLNACEGARGGGQDLFSSTAATLVRSGIPAVLAMQYEVTDGSAIQLARTFYEALVHNLPVDAALVDARDAISRRNRHSLEWATPVLYMRSPDGQLFALDANIQADSNSTVVHTTPTPLEPQAASPATSSILRRDKAKSPQLRQLLADLYPDESSARRVVADAGMDGKHIAFSSQATNNWHAILDEADKSGHTEALIDVAAKEYGDNPAVSRALMAVTELRGDQELQLNKQTKVARESQTSVRCKSKYAPIQDWLLGQAAAITNLQISLDQIEQLTGEPLPASARTYHPWWSNTAAHHTQSQAWLSAGWLVTDCDLTNGLVTFERSRNAYYQVFFDDILQGLRKQLPTLTASAKARPRNYLAFNSGLSGFYYSCSFIRGKHFRIELYCDTRNQKITKQAFDKLKEHQIVIEHKLNAQLKWDRLDNRKACRIALERPGAISDSPEQLDWLKQWAITNLPIWVEVFQPYLRELESYLNELDPE